jgi:GT2 family glycosyltransferase
MNTRAQTLTPPAVSIIIPVFNKCDLTLQCLKTLAETSTRTSHEIIVVDNASSDATPQRLREVSRPNWRVIRNETNRGFASACNQGAAVAAGKYLLFLNNDTIPVTGWLEPLVDEMRSHPEVAMVGARLLYESGLVQHAGVAFGRESRSPFHPHRLLRHDDPRVNIRREMQAVTAACVLVRPRWFHDCGGFSEDYRNGYEDLDLCLHIRKRGGVIVYQPKSAIIHLESQTSGRMKFDSENRALFFRRWTDTILADEDAYYFEGGFRIVGRTNPGAEEARLARINSETERRQWSIVAQTQRHAAAGRRPEMERALADAKAWPADPAVRRWAGALCLHLHLPDFAKQHFDVALALADDPELRAQLDLELRPSAAGGVSPARWEAMARSGFRALRAGDFATAQTALETALLRGAPPRLVLPGWRQAAHSVGASTDAEATRHALLAMSRVNPFTARNLAAPTATPTGNKDGCLDGCPTTVAPAPLASIIVLALNQIEHTRKCVDSLLAHTRPPFEVILVDNGSTDGTAEYFAQLRQQHANFKVVTNRGNRGFAAGNNQGLAIATGEILVLLNNDTLVTPRWIVGMTAVFDADSSVGLVGPVSNRVSGPQQIQTSCPTDAAMLEFAKTWTAQNAGQTQVAQRLVGFCLGFRRAVLTAIGGLDESFGSGNFEDDDFCIRARLAGFTSRIARSVFIHHIGSQTFKGAKIDYRAAMLRNWDYFRSKWRLPAEASLERGYPMPASKPERVALQVALPVLSLTHKADGESHWLEAAPVTAKADLPVRSAVARLGNLDEARALFGRREFAPAWNATLAALRLRPFHPEAYLLLAEIALSAGDAASSRTCAQHARLLAPGWKAPKQFLQKNLKGNARFDWLKLPEFKRQRLTVCVLTKNEEKFLAQCLASVKGLADQLLVLDTGSTDRTVEIAQEHGAEVHTFTWCDDFSAARNAALESITGDWVLMLDADEELPVDQHARLREDMQRADAIAFRLPLVNRGEEAQGWSFVPRLFRNAPGVLYYGRIHEQVFPSLIPYCKAWGLETRLGTAQLLHHGYAKEIIKDRNKIARNLGLLRLAIAERPQDANLQMNLGLELVRSGALPTGLTHYREAFRLMSALAPSEVVPELREVLLTQFTCQLYKVRGHEEVVCVLNSPLAKNGGLTASLHFALGLAHFELGQLREAADQMKQCLAKRKQPGLSPINTDILTAAPHHCLALSLARLNEAAGAEKVFKAGLTEGGRTDDLKADYAKLLAAQNRPVDALHLLHEVVQQNAQHVNAWKLGGEIALSRPEFLEFATDWTGEAIHALPNESAIAAHRAEALLMSQQTGGALKLWTAICNGERAPRALAAALLCATVNSQPLPRPASSAEEVAVSRAFVEWYRRLVNAGAEKTITCLNARAEALRPALPTAMKILDAVLAEAHAPDELAVC